jgi:pSer/pThr/pTyr-binding forkhead associated (FHA) protein
MKEKLRLIEIHLKEFIEKSATGLFISPDSEIKLVKELVKAMEEEIRIDEDESITAPNIYCLNVSSNYVADIRSNQDLLNNLALQLMEAGNDANIEFESPPSINVFPDENLQEGEFTVNAIWQSPSSVQTQAMDIDLDTDPGSSIPPKAFLIVGGSKIFTLEEDVINIGRKLDNHLVIDDPRVSRKHGQLRAVKGRYMLFDLKSSGGTYVNGERINQIVLHPGDVISLAGVPIVYGQDAIRSISETQEYHRPETSSDTATTNVQSNQIDLDTFDQ